MDLKPTIAFMAFYTIVVLGTGVTVTVVFFQ